MVLPRLRLGQLLVDAGLLSPDMLAAALEHQKSDGRRLGMLLVERGLVDETQLTQILSHQLSVPWVSLLHIELSSKLLDLVPRETAEKFGVVPIYVRHLRGQGDTLYVAMDDPTNDEALRACAASSGLPVRAMIAPPSDVRAALRVYSGGRVGLGAESTAPSGADEPSPFEGARSRRMRSAPPPADTGTAEVPAPRSHPAPTPASSPPAARTSDSPPVSSRRSRPPPSVPPPSGRRPPNSKDDDPTIEHAEIELPPRASRAGRMVSLTLLDGTTITLPARPRAEGGAEASAPLPGHRDEALTTKDLVAALRAVSHGADGRELLGGDVRWEALFAALLSLLLKKNLIADYELVEELRKV